MGWEFGLWGGPASGIAVAGTVTGLGLWMQVAGLITNVAVLCNDYHCTVVILKSSEARGPI